MFLSACLFWISDSKSWGQKVSITARELAFTDTDISSSPTFLSWQVYFRQFVLVQYVFFFSSCLIWYLSWGFFMNFGALEIRNQLKPYILMLQHKLRYAEFKNSTSFFFFQITVLTPTNTSSTVLWSFTSLVLVATTNLLIQHAYILISAEPMPLGGSLKKSTCKPYRAEDWRTKVPDVMGPYIDWDKF